MKRFAPCVICILFLAGPAFGHERLQVVSASKAAQTFASVKGSWVPLDLKTPVDSTTVIKNNSEPPSRIVIRDWGKSLLYEITLARQEFSMSAALAAASSQDAVNGLDFLAIKPIKESALPTIHIDRSTAEARHRSTEKSAQHTLAMDYIALLTDPDQVFRIDGLKVMQSDFDLGCEENGKGDLIVSNYSDDAELYFVVLLIRRTADGKKSVTPMMPNDCVCLAPLSEKVLPVTGDSAGAEVLVIATGEYIDPIILAARMELSDGKKVFRFDDSKKIGILARP